MSHTPRRSGFPLLSTGTTVTTWICSARRISTSARWLRQKRCSRRSFEMPAAGHLGHDQDVNKRAWPLFLLGRRRSDEALAAADHAAAARVAAAAGAGTCAGEPDSRGHEEPRSRRRRRQRRAASDAGDRSGGRNAVTRLPARPGRVSAADRRDGQRPGDAAGRGRQAARGARSRSVGRGAVSTRSGRHDRARARRVAARRADGGADAAARPGVRRHAIRARPGGRTTRRRRRGARRVYAAHSASGRRPTAISPSCRTLRTRTRRATRGEASAQAVAQISRPAPAPSPKVIDDS